MVLDEPKETDDQTEFDGVTYLIDKNLSAMSGGVKVDYVDQGYARGFVLTSNNDLGGGGCGSGCSC